MRKLFTYSLILTMLLTSSWVYSQYSNTYYHMFGVPQANQLNPAFQPICNGYLGFPTLSPLKFSVESNSITYGDIFEWDATAGNYITFMHPDGDKQKFVNALEPVNMVRFEMASGILSTGWRSKQFYFTLDFSERITEEITFSKDLVEFILNGNLYKENFNFGDLGNNINYFHEIALGVSYNHEDEMQFGLRAKLLLGGANMTTRSSDINLKATEEEWRIRSDMQIDASIPFLEELPLDEDGNLDMDSLSNSDADLLFGFPEGVGDLLSPGYLSTIGGLKNPGFAIDFGFNYKPVEKLSISASVVDLGFIRWKNYVYNFNQDLDYTFEGVEIRLEDDYSPGDDLFDSLENDLQIAVSEEAYTTMMTGKVYLGAAYNLTERVRFGGVFRTRIQNYKFYNQFTFSANVQPIGLLSTSLSYSIYGNSYMNLGLGLSLRLGPLNLYFITDQAPSAYFWPKEFSSLNFRLGLNLVWGCRKLPKGMKDRPLID